MLASDDRTSDAALDGVVIDRDARVAGKTRETDTRNTSDASPRW